MKKCFVVLALTLFVGVGMVIAETDYVALPIIHDIQTGKDNGNAIKTLKVTENAVIDGTLAVAGVLSTDSRAVVTSKDTASGNMVIEAGQKTTVLETIHTNTYTTAFKGGTVPVVLWRAISQDSATAWAATNATVSLSNKFTIAFGATNVTFQYQVIGYKD